MLDIELWIVVDENGNIGVSATGPDEAGEAYQDDIGGHGPRRCIKVALKVPAPGVVTLSGTVPAESEAGCELVAE
jgi:hypothetical protein